MRLNLLLLIILLIALLSGCTHKKLINAGDDYLAQGKYQQAVEKYQRALTNKPNDKKTLVKFNQANTLFQGWLDTLDRAALRAEHNKAFAKATILYAKLAQHRHDVKYRQKQRQFHQKNMNEHGLRISLNIQQSQLHQTFGQALDNIVFVDKTSNKPNELTLSFLLDDVEISINHKAHSKITEYISAYETVINPEFQDIQQHILALRTDVKDLRNILFELKEEKQKQQTQLQLIDKDLQITQLKINQVHNDNTLFQQLTKQTYYLEINFKKQENLIKEINKDIRSLQHDIDINEHNLDDLFVDLQLVPKLMDMPLYSEYEYTVKTLIQTATSVLNINRNNYYLGQVSRKKSVGISYSDQYHKAHKQIELKADPKIIKTKTQLTQMLYAQARKQIKNVIETNIMQYQQALIAKANNSNNIETRLNQWLISGIIRKEGLPQKSANRVEQQLYNEFGQGGRFNINALLSSN